MKLKILIPIYNDWKSLTKLLEKINFQLKNLNHDVSIIIVNDFSTEIVPKILGNYENFHSIKILNMKSNMGHARCIATGLKYISENCEFDYVIPMDGDGEDRPEEIKNFIEKINQNFNEPIVGERVKRSEGLIFKIGYIVHKLFTFIFTGRSVKFGNFTCLPKKTVIKLVNDKSTWSSFSGSLSKLESKLISTPSERGVRFFGPSKMNYLSLFVHSFAIMAVFKTTVILRSILFYAVYLMLISKNLSFVTVIPLVLIFIFGILIFKVSRRESIDSLKKYNSFIDSVVKFK